MARADGLRRTSRGTVPAANRLDCLHICRPQL